MSDKEIAELVQRLTYLEAYNDVLAQQNDKLHNELQHHMKRIEILMGAPCDEHDFQRVREEEAFAPQSLRNEIELKDGYAKKITYECVYCGEEQTEWESILSN